MLEIKFLGCGSSGGVPKLCCDCDVCISSDHKDKRKRSSILIRYRGHNLLVDVSPDFRQQALNYDVQHIDAVLLTHPHYDHISGLPELISMKTNGRVLPVYTNDDTIKYIEKTYPYLLSAINPYNTFLKLNRVRYGDELIICDLKVKPIQQDHIVMSTVGFVFDEFAYCIDFKRMDEETISYLKSKKLELLIVDCIGFMESRTHLCYEESLDFISKVNAKRNILTHIGHTAGYKDLSQRLKDVKEDIIPAYDGMVVMV